MFINFKKSNISSSVTAVSAFLITTASAMAQSGEGVYRHGPRMMWGGDGMGGFGMMFGFVFMFILIAAIVVGTIFLLRYIGIGGHSPHSGASHSGLRPVDILEERYAKGEIDTKDFEARKALLIKKS